MNITIHAIWSIFLWCICLYIEFVGNRVMYILSFSDTTKHFSKYANLHFDRHVWEAQFFHTLTNIFVILVDMW